MTGVAYFDSQDSSRSSPQTWWWCPARPQKLRACCSIPGAGCFLNGLGNRYDWVGRNLQGHAYAGAYGLFDYDVYDDLGPGASIAICDYNHGNPGLVGGGVLCNEFIRLPIQFSSMTPPTLPRWGKAHKDFMRQAYRRCIVRQGPAQEMPVFEARVQVDPRVKDNWGIPVVRLSGVKPPAHAGSGKIPRPPKLRLGSRRPERSPLGRGRRAWA